MTAHKKRLLKKRRAAMAIVGEWFLEQEKLGRIKRVGVKFRPETGREQIVWEKSADPEGITQEDPPWFDEEDVLRAGGSAARSRRRSNDQGGAVNESRPAS
jgi:hypothetical protein